MPQARGLATGTPAAAGARRVVWRVVKYTYGTLALIPMSFTVAAGYHWLVDHPPQVSRAYAFFAWTGFLCLPLSVVLLAAYPVERLFDWERRRLLQAVQRTWAMLTVRPFFTPRFEGVERVQELLQKRERAVVYVSNHQSWADVYSLLCLPWPISIRFVAKEEIFLIPVVGWSMFLIGHVGVRRASKGSRGSVVATCTKQIGDGLSVFVFAEGTRSRDGFVQPFRKGAFVIAENTDVPIVPISISGTGKLMPANRGETWLEKGEDAPVVIKFHEPIYASDVGGAEALQLATQRVIEDALALSEDSDESKLITG